MANRDLPEDVLIQILSTLPVKCLLRFKSVCKSWYVLITDPDFISKHLAWVTSHNPHRSVVLNCKHEITRTPWLSLRSRDTLEVSRYVDVSQFFSQEIFSLRIYGPCNGILCLLGRLGHGDFIDDYRPSYGLVLWNPATRESKALPIVHAPHMLYTNCHGFGFDPKTNDYKVVRILSFRVELYSLRTGSWKVINPSLNTAYQVSSSRYPSYLNGVYYWKAFVRGNRDQYFLLSFDMSNEVFQETPLPFLSEKSYTSEVAVINDSVALVVEYRGQERKWFDIRVMKGCGLKGTWTKLFTIGPLPQLCSLLEFRDDGLVLLRNANGWLELYDPISQERQDLQVYGDQYLQAVSYTETLVLLNR